MSAKVSRRASKHAEEWRSGVVPRVLIFEDGGEYIVDYDGSVHKRPERLEYDDVVMYWRALSAFKTRACEICNLEFSKAFRAAMKCGAS